ncbi:protein-S-isoprenylcysteine O-methyltransferase [Favolaschia claudopus]|uniref:Protein-S-isoprenylcysteine O-methyltransferase n=1 Tax=Favolaschia claudopus TaxID=2862362 RepID=A0AAW0EG33_9AGAR
MASAETLLKSILILVASLASNYGLTPPTAKQPKDSTQNEAVYRGQSFEVVVYLWTNLGRIVVMLLGLLHVSAMITLELPGRLPQTIAQTLCPYPAPNIHGLRELSVTFGLGVSLMILGSLLRGWCFHALGQHFTFHVTVASNHALVTTGPYAYVRHPSYTAVFMMLLGFTLAYIVSHGSYISECWSLSSTGGKGFVYVGWFLVPAYTVVSLAKRGIVEDGLLKQRFGTKWVQYATRVPFRFIPYLV